MKKVLVVMSVCSVLLSVHPSFDVIFSVFRAHRFVLALPLSLSTLVLLMRERNLDRRTFFYIGLVVFSAVWAIGTTLFTPLLGKDSFISGAFGLCVFMPIIFFSAFSVRKYSDLVGQTIFVLGLISFVHFAYSLTQGLTTTSGFRSLVGDSMDSVNYQNAAFFLGLVPMFSLSSVLFKKKIGIWHSALYIVGIVFVGMTGARAALVAILLLSAAVLLANIRKFIDSPGKLVSAVLIIGIFTLVVTVIYAQIVPYLVVFDRLVILSNGGDSSQRVFLFSSAIKLWLEGPYNFLFGAGLGAFPHYIFATGPGMYPHNFFLELLAECGLVGTLPMIAMVYLACRPRSNSSVWQLYLLILASYSVISFQFIGSISTLWTPGYFMFLSIMCLGQGSGQITSPLSQIHEVSS